MTNLKKGDTIQLNLIMFQTKCLIQYIQAEKSLTINDRGTYVGTYVLGVTKDEDIISECPK